MLCVWIVFPSIGLSSRLASVAFCIVGLDPEGTFSEHDVSAERVCSMTCFHCSGSGLCSCAACAKDTPCSVVAGPCLACKGKRRAELMIPFLIAHNIEPGDARWWVYWRSGGHSGRRFIPDQLFDEPWGV